MHTTQLKKLIQNHQTGWSLDQAFYTHPAIFDKEWEFIWKKNWLFAGTTAEIPKAGDYFVYQLQNNSIVIIRGNKGEVYALHNSCRHRGSLICLQEKGNAPKLVCPYHQWVYDKDGSLLNARLMPDDFDRSEYGLHKVALQVVSGFIFISLAENPPSLEKLKDDYSPFLEPFRINEAKLAYKKRYTLRTNWKLIAENFRECYHCGPAHPEYCSAVIGANMKESAAATLLEKKPVWQKNGLATETVAFEKGSFHFAIRYPLRPGVQSYSLDGKAVAIPMGEHRDYDAGVLGMVVYPNFWMDAVSDYMWTMRLTAVSPSQTIIDLSWLVDKKAIEGKDYTLERLIEFWKITGEQDWELCENNFKGIESNAYTPGPYAPVEADVAEYIEWYKETMKAGLAETQ
jgi:phenylpropionate dioxygenase-like ring-hydroxylating dioxygenase large terminal subunit